MTELLVGGFSSSRESPVMRMLSAADPLSDRDAVADRGGVQLVERV
jgi:hypothetical protein